MEMVHTPKPVRGVARRGLRHITVIVTVKQLNAHAATADQCPFLTGMVILKISETDIMRISALTVAIQLASGYTTERAIRRPVSVVTQVAWMYGIILLTQITEMAHIQVHA